MVRRRSSTPLFALAGASFAAGPALAHGELPVTPETLAASWTFDPLVLLPLLLAHWLYGRGWLALRGLAGEAVPRWRLVAFLAGEALLVAALVSPLDALSGTLLSAHMAQHVVVIALSPPLLVLGRPELACFFGLPRPVRRFWARNALTRSLMRLLAAAARPLPATALHGAALWVWHVPAFFEGAAAHELMHALEHLFFFGTALLFWHAVIGAAHARGALAAGGALACLATLVHGGFLSALLTLSPTLLFPESTAWAPIWGLEPIEDQQLAGAIMWVPAGAAYLAAGVFCGLRLLSPPAGPRAAPA